MLERMQREGSPDHMTSVNQNQNVKFIPQISGLISNTLFFHSFCLTIGLWSYYLCLHVEAISN